MSLQDSLEFTISLESVEKDQSIAAPILRETRARLTFLVEVGLGYLTLSRNAGSLSGGEAQRIRLATQIGSGLTGVLYVLDEPSIGLHQRDNNRLIDTLVTLRDLGNTLIVVEHDEDTIRTADWLVDIGPEAGEHGGTIVHSGSVPALQKAKNSLTAKYVSGEWQVVEPREPRPLDPDRQITVRGARENNLQDIDVTIPLGVLTAVTGVSGSGKSSLINDIVYRSLANRLNKAKHVPGNTPVLRGSSTSTRLSTSIKLRSDEPPAQTRPRTQGFRQDSQSLCRNSGGQNARVFARALQLQRQGRTL